VAEIFADEFAQAELSVGRLNVKVNRQQPESGEAGDCNQEEKRCLNYVFHKPGKSKVG
jgi:hypothetical protein